MLHDVMAVDDIPVGGQKVINVANVQLLICHTESDIFAIENVCPHAAMPLAGGRMTENVIRCPSHGAKFDLRTGEPVVGTRLTAVKTFDITITDGRISVEIP